MADKLPAWMIDALSKTTWDAEHNRLHGLPEIGPARYKELDAVLKRLRGKWTGGKRPGHYFPYDASDAIDSLIEDGKMPANNPLAYFPTPAPVIDVLLEPFLSLDPSHSWLDSPDMRVLEPSAGGGAIADRIRQLAPHASLDLVEYDPINVHLLERKGYAPHHGDFVTHNGKTYDAVIMNPPFSVAGSPLLYIDHIRHALSLLRQNGLLAAVIPTVLPSNTPKTREIRRLIADYGIDVTELPAKSFAESGAGVATTVIHLRKIDPPPMGQPMDGYPSGFAYHFALTLQHDGKLIQQLQEKALRLRPGDVDLLGRPVRPDPFFIHKVIATYERQGSDLLPIDDEYMNQYADVVAETMQELIDEPDYTLREKTYEAERQAITRPSHRRSHAQSRS